MEKLLSAKELAYLLGVAEATVRTWVTRRQIPVVRVRRSLRFAEEEIRDWLRAQHEVRAEEDPQPTRKMNHS
jgi:excisionase family DNA binding protein